MMGVLKIRESGKDQGGKPWWQDLGKASNLAVGEVILERIADNYEKGCFLQVQEKRDKKNITHKTVNTTGSEDKKSATLVTEIWQRKESDQNNISEATDNERDVLWHWVATLNSPLDAKKAMPGIAEITPKNSVLIMGGVDNNGDWQEGATVKGRAKDSIGGLNADEQPDSKPKKGGKGGTKPPKEED